MRRLHLRHGEQTCKFADEIKLKAHTFHADNRRVVAGFHTLLAALPPAFALSSTPSLPCVAHLKFIHPHRTCHTNPQRKLLRIFINFNLNLRLIRIQVLFLVNV